MVSILLYFYKCGSSNKMVTSFQVEVFGTLILLEVPWKNPK
jgi:hypothetical protein